MNSVKHFKNSACEYLLSLSSDGPNVNKAIKTNINSKLKVNYQRELVDTGPCQLYVVHSSFRKGVEGYDSDVENLCIDMYYFLSHHQGGKIMQMYSKI